MYSFITLSTTPTQRDTPLCQFHTTPPFFDEGQMLGRKHAFELTVTGCNVTQIAKRGGDPFKLAAYGKEADD